MESQKNPLRSERIRGPKWGRVGDGVADGVRGRRAATAFRILLVLLLACVSTARADEIEPREPGEGAKPHTIYLAKSSGGLRYTWVVPAEPRPEGERAMTVLLHGTGLDHRWGHANHPAGSFRPHDVVISVEGTSPGQGESRLFLGKKEDVESFAAFLAEMRTKFAVDRVLLYGHSQGGFFVAYYAGERPETIAGAVAHASGTWSGTRTKGGIEEVPLVFLHGTADPVVTYGNSVGTRDSFVKQGLDLVRLRRMPGYNHWPNAVRTAECLTWCEGMVTKDAGYALACAEELLRPKGKDSVQYRMAVDFSGAASILGRFSSKSEHALGKTPSGAKKRAQVLMRAIEKHAAEHRKKIQNGLRKDLRLDGRPWLGHLLAVREDFRGVPTIEELAKAVRFDERRAEQAKAVGRMLSPWYDGKPPAEIVAAAVRELPDAHLHDVWPVGYGEKLTEWLAAADEHGIDPKVRAQGAVVEAWRKGLEDGREAYRETWLEWKLPR